MSGASHPAGERRVVQRRIIDDAIVNRKINVLIGLAFVFLAVILLQALLKYALFVYQSWVSESAIKTAREELATIARGGEGAVVAPETVSVLGPEIDHVGGFIGTSLDGGVQHQGEHIIQHAA